MNMVIHYSRPYIDDEVINEVNDVFTNTGWLTSGPKVLKFEDEISNLSNVVCGNSWSSGATLASRWYEVGPCGEVIIPSRTYAATALCILNLGAKPVMVDIDDDFCIDSKQLANKITPKTKAIIPVDILGWPCNYDSIFKIVRSSLVKRCLSPSRENQI